MTQLTRAEQDDILTVVTASYRLTHYHLLGYWPGPEDTEDAFRSSLRLDDLCLAAIISESRLTGKPLTWSTTV